MLIKVNSVANIGIETIKIEVEINIASMGLPKFNIVGLADKAVEESKQRVVTSISNSGVSFPRRRITVNLAPADIPKEGSCYDLPIAVGILSVILNSELPDKAIFYGELSLDGSLRHTKGVFLLALYAKRLGFNKIFIPESTLNEAISIRDLEIFPVKNLKEIVAYLKKTKPIKSVINSEQVVVENSLKSEIDYNEIIDNVMAKKACEIVAAGGHNILMSGIPGSGKTMMARALPGILPKLTDSETFEVMQIYSVTGNIPPNGCLIKTRPFRSPHHTTSTVGLIGGGSKPQPGEISLAHCGVLFLDEFGEFPQYTLDALRQPLEDGFVTISRSRGRLLFPANFILVAATNPCPCGFYGSEIRACICSSNELARYNKKISGPILDRIDLHVQVDSISIDKIRQYSNEALVSESSSKILERVEQAREIQTKRFLGTNIICNSHMKNKDIKKYVKITSEASDLLLNIVKKFGLSTRTYFRLLKVAQTIADLEKKDVINNEIILETIQFRVKNDEKK